MYFRVPRALRGRCPKKFIEISYRRKIPVVNELAEAKDNSEAFFLRSLGYEKWDFVCTKCILPFNSEKELKEHLKVHQPDLSEAIGLKKKSSKKVEEKPEEVDNGDNNSK